MLVVDVDVAKVQSMLGLLSKRLSGTGMRGVFKSLSVILRNDMVRNFKNMASPSGQPWQELSPATKLQRLRKSKGKHFKKGKPLTQGNLSAYGQRALVGNFAILRSTSGLMNSIGNPANGGVLNISERHVSVGSRLPYAAIHQLGGKAGRGGKVRIPARPFVGMSANAERQIINTINAYLGTAQA